MTIQNEHPLLLWHITSGPTAAECVFQDWMIMIVILLFTRISPFV